MDILKMRFGTESIFCFAYTYHLHFLVSYKLFDAKEKGVLIFSKD